MAEAEGRAGRDMAQPGGAGPARVRLCGRGAGSSHRAPADRGGAGRSPPPPGRMVGEQVAGVHRAGLAVPDRRGRDPPPGQLHQGVRPAGAHRARRRAGPTHPYRRGGPARAAGPLRCGPGRGNGGRSHRLLPPAAAREPAPAARGGRAGPALGGGGGGLARARLHAPVGEASTVGGGADRAVAVRPDRVEPQPRGAVVGLRLPDRDLRSRLQAGLRLLRAAGARRRASGGPPGPQDRPSSRDAAGSGRLRRAGGRSWPPSRATPAAPGRVGPLRRR